MQMFKIWNIVSGLDSLVIEFEDEECQERKGPPENLRKQGCTLLLFDTNEVVACLQT